MGQSGDRGGTVGGERGGRKKRGKSPEHDKAGRKIKGKMKVKMGAPQRRGPLRGHSRTLI